MRLPLFVLKNILFHMHKAVSHVFSLIIFLISILFNIFYQYMSQAHHFLVIFLRTPTFLMYTIRNFFCILYT